MSNPSAHRHESEHRHEGECCRERAHGHANQFECSHHHRLVPEREHSHDRECESEHRHEDGRVLVDEKALFLKISEQDGFLVASYRLQLSGTVESRKADLSRFASDVAQAVESRNGLVGHVKLFAQQLGDSVRISATSPNPDIVEYRGDSVSAEGVAIVMLVDRDWYEQAMLARLRELVY